MTKKQFLEKLSKRLAILSEDERKDIINEYKDIIEEKIKHGTNEGDAVSEFGDFDELVKGILSAYKINPDCGKENTTKEKAKDFLESGEVLIKDGAKKLTEGADRLMTGLKENGTEITVELVFELILKGICALIIMGILAIPFSILSHLGGNIFNFTIFPFGSLLRVVWKIAVSLFYFAACFFVIIALFKEYIRKSDSKSEKKRTNNSKKNTQNEKDSVNKSINDKEEKEVTKEEYRRDPVVRNTSNNTSHTFSNLILILLKIFMIFVFIIPLWFVIIGLFFVLSFFIYGLTQGIHVIGLVLGTVGAIVFLIQLCHVLYNGIFNSMKVHLYPFIIALVFLMSGTIMTIDFFTGIEYIDTAPTEGTKTEKYEYTINKPLTIRSDDDESTFIVDNTLVDGKAIIEVTYYKSYIDISKSELDQADTFLLQFHSREVMRGRDAFHLILNNLKNNCFYNYNKISDIQIKVTTNENTKNLIHVD